MTFLGPQNFSLEDGPVPKQDEIPQLPLIAFDPGGTTGWSLIVLPVEAFELKDISKILQHARFWRHGQVDCFDVNNGAFVLRKNLIDQWPTAALVFEKFQLYSGSRKVDLTPVELNAILGHHLWIKRRAMHFQQPSMAKRMNDARMKDLKVYVREGGLEHARDADRHVVMMIRRCMENKGWKERLWPHVFANN
jgi:hypothetical protein